MKNGIKKITTTIKDNKHLLGHKALVIGGTALGAFIAGSVLAKTEPEIVVEGDVTVETTVVTDPTI